MKKIVKLTLLLFVCLAAPAYACEVCKARQPETLKGITHGTGPQADTDLVIVWVAVAIVGITLVLSIKYLIKPQEPAHESVKNSIIV